MRVGVRRLLWVGFLAHGWGAASTAGDILPVSRESELYVHRADQCLSCPHPIITSDSDRFTELGFYSHSLSLGGIASQASTTTDDGAVAFLEARGPRLSSDFGASLGRSSFTFDFGIPAAGSLFVTGTGHLQEQGDLIGHVGIDVSGSGVGLEYSARHDGADIDLVARVRPGDFQIAALAYGNGSSVESSEASLNFRLTIVPGDFNTDGVLDLSDVDLLTQEMARETNDPLFDLTGDGGVSHHDLATWVEQLYGSLLGDANLDYQVDVGDFILWNDHKFTASDLWSNGDFDGDGVVGASDFVIWNANKFRSASSPRAPAIPEPLIPSGVWLIAFCLLAERS